MNRFSRQKKSVSQKLIASLLLFVFLILAFCLWSSRYSARMTERQYAHLEAALRRDITSCYAQEGHYPEDLDYIKNHYGLTYDEDVFFVDYHVQGQNMYPDYTIIIKGD